MLGPVMVTGATGWVGTALLAELQSRGVPTFALTRRAAAKASGSVRWIRTDDDFNNLERDWPAGVAAVVHLAARVHQMNDVPAGALARYRSTNTAATLHLAQLALAHGAERFIFLSSIKAMGEAEQGHALRETDVAHPSDPYGVSKREAEIGLQHMSTERFKPTILRVPLVYGPGVSANFASLMRAVKRGVPLPLGAATAPRSLLGMGNLIDALMACLEQPQAKGQLLHFADQESLPVCDLIVAIGQALNRKARLIDVPIGMLETVGRLLGKGDQVMRLTTPLRVDISRARDVLGWQPRYSLAEGLRDACCSSASPHE